MKSVIIVSFVLVALIAFVSSAPTTQKPAEATTETELYPTKAGDKMADHDIQKREANEGAAHHDTKACNGSHAGATGAPKAADGEPTTVAADAETPKAE